MSANDRHAYTVTDQAGPWVAGRRTMVGAVLMLTEAEAEYDLREGAIVLGGAETLPPDPLPVLGSDSLLAQRGGLALRVAVADLIALVGDLAGSSILEAALAHADQVGSDVLAAASQSASDQASAVLASANTYALERATVAASTAAAYADGIVAGRGLPPVGAVRKSKLLAALEVTEAGRIDALEAALVLDPANAAFIDWKFEPFLTRNSPLAGLIQDTFSFSPAAMTNLFIAAAALPN